MQSVELFMTSAGYWRGHDAKTRLVFLRWVEDIVRDGDTGYWMEPPPPPPSDPPLDAQPLPMLRSLPWPFQHSPAAITAAAAA